MRRIIRTRVKVRREKQNWRRCLKSSSSSLSFVRFDWKQFPKLIQWLMFLLFITCRRGELLHCCILPICRRHCSGWLRLQAKSAQSWQCLRSLWWEVRRLETRTRQGAALRLECLASVLAVLKASTLSITLTRVGEHTVVSLTVVLAELHHFLLTEGWKNIIYNICVLCGDTTSNWILDVIHILFNWLNSHTVPACLLNSFIWSG